MHSNAHVADEFARALEENNYQAAMDLLADDVEWHEIGGAEPIRGKQALVERFQGSMDDYQIQARAHATTADDSEHVVQLMEVTATRGGRSFDYRTAEIYHVRDGKIAARWAFSDDTGRINEFFA
jgi:ketosteroid isomerase-like protein